MDNRHLAHAAFLYNTDAAYFAHVVSFLESTRTDRRLVLIPLRGRWPDLSARLASAGHDWQGAVARKELVVFPAESLLEDVVPGGMFDRRRFDAAVARMIEPDVPHRVYGDAAALLVGRDNLSAALAIEHAWTETAGERPLEVCCGYDLRFFSEEHEWPVRSVINGHRHASHEPGMATSRFLPVHRDAGEQDPPLVLLWDDHRDTRDMYAETLTFSGYRVIVADDTEDTIALAGAYRPELILMNVRLVEERAADAMRTLRTQHAFTAPILALTSHAFHAERARISGAGFDAVLSKPCLPDELLTHVATALRRRA
jgi:two-component system, cell cycle response regulator DivK